jgi:diguanylate cyclase (GGDEF)-like protein
MALRQAGRAKTTVAVVFVDIDHFKRINDTLGHPTGDELLQVVAQRLQKAVRKCDTLARMGGDEFTVVLTNLGSASDAGSVVRKLRESLRKPFVLSGQETVITASFGIALYPDDGIDMDELVRKADIALYAAKHDGRDTYDFFDKAHEVFDDTRLFMEHELRVALDRGLISPVFQALVDARNGAVVGAEALARWRHPDRGMVPPSTFVPLAEDTGLIRRLGQAITQAAAATAVASAEMGALHLSLNVSAIEIRSSNFVESLQETLAQAGLAADRVQLEITERLFIDPSPEVLEKLDRLRRLGMKIAIDDFGIGSTSLRLLHTLPVDVLKIDRSFISGSDRDRRADALVRAIIEMGHALDMQIVAEGVETTAQVERLAAYGCDFLQGYLFCEPMPAAEFAAWLAAQRARREAG